jgi:hypothetical protein
LELFAAEVSNHVSQSKQTTLMWIFTMRRRNSSWTFTGTLEGNSSAYSGYVLPPLRLSNALSLLLPLVLAPSSWTLDLPPSLPG